MPADGFREVGGFDPVHFYFASEDRDFCDRWRQRGKRMAYTPEAKVYHAHALTLRTFCRQYFTYGRGALCFYRAQARRGLGTAGDQLGLYRRFPALLRPLIRDLRPLHRLALLPLLAVWQGANLAGMGWEAAQQALTKRQMLTGASADRLVER